MQKVGCARLCTAIMNIVIMNLGKMLMLSLLKWGRGGKLMADELHMLSNLSPHVGINEVCKLAPICPGISSNGFGQEWNLQRRQYGPQACLLQANKNIFHWENNII